jgi:hypothetical protein
MTSAGFIGKKVFFFHFSRIGGFSLRLFQIVSDKKLGPQSERA